MVALESHECFAIDALQIGAEHFRSMTSLAYELEQYLPLDAERMAIGVVSHSESISRKKRGQGLVVVADKESVGKTVSDLEQHGIWVAGIAPSVLMGAQYWAEESAIQNCELLWKAEGKEAWDYLKIENGKPTQWRWLDEHSAISIVASPDSAIDVHVVGILNDSSNEILAASGKATLQHDWVPVGEYANKAEKLWVAGHWNAWLDWGRNNLKTQYAWAPMYGSLLAMTGSVFLLLMACVGYVYLQTVQFEQSIAENDAARSAEFERLFPKQSVPRDIAGRLQSELRKLETNKQDLSKEPPIYSSLPVMVHFLNQLPEEAVFRIDRITANSQQIGSVDASVKSLSDSEALLANLRSGGFQFAPPGVNNMKDGFSIRLERLTLEPRKTPNKEPVKEASLRP